ncbi:MAG: SHOCT domain-containing protein [Novosphingobium sp.]|uniref:SHOCT domain-containing protein n=1 Tax=Novosphingobium sp. TaxID=1874826 RepID=UPI003C7C82FD
MADWIEQLERLAQLHKDGVLTDEEFAGQKAKLLAERDVPPVAAAPVIAPAPAPVDPAPTWDSTTYVEEPARGGVPKWALIAVPVALVLAGAAWFGSSIIGGGRSDPELSGGAIATAAPSAAAMPSAEPSAEAQLPAALDGTLAFAGASDCKAGGTLEAVYKKLGSAADLGSGKGITVRLDAFSNPLGIEVKNSTDADGVETKLAWLRFPANTIWHGLKLSRVTSTSTIVPESDGSYTRTINFIEEPDKVRSTLARLGFGAPRSPDYAELHDDACGGSMQIVAVAGGSALSCTWGC